MSSLNDKKNALFSKNSSSVTAPTSNLLTNSKPTPSLNNPSLPIRNITLQYGSGGISSTLLTPTQKQKKLDEAKDHLAKGNKYLETSMFQWTPDYLG